MSEPEKIEISRPMVGIIALVCLCGAAGLWIAYPTTSPERIGMLKAALMRVGLVMWAFWLALPSKSREAAWANVSSSTFWGIGLTLVAVAAKPRMVLYLLPFAAFVAIVMFLLRPREKKRPSDRVGRSS